jgi:hypothetical protein
VKHLAVMCLLLTFWSAIALAAHHHSNATEAAKCIFSTRQSSPLSSKGQ